MGPTVDRPAGTKESNLNGAKRILVVDDNPALANVVRYNLVQAGFQASVARNGREACHLLQEEDFDCVVTDYQMPEMDGGELCLWMRKSPRLAALPVFLLTAKELELDALKIIHEMGVVRIWPKPFSPMELREALVELLSDAGSPV